MRLVKAIAMLGFVCWGAAAHGAETATAWVESYNSKVRLLAGQLTDGRAARTVAGVEIALAAGWKTYWRNPGDSGGVPPHFDFEASENVMSARVLFPAPQRLADASGDAVGYKGSVTFPIEIVAKDPAKPVRLAISLEYGICREICVPAEAKLDLQIPPGAAGSLPEPIAAALKRVPTPADKPQAGDPTLGAVRAETTGASPKIVAAITYPGGAAGADAFVEAPEGIYLPLPKKTGDDGKGTLTFEIDLSSGIDLAELKGKPLLFTLVSADRQAEAVWTMP